MQPGLAGIVALHRSCGAGCARSRRREEPVEVPVRGNAHEGSDGLQADDGVVVGEEGAEGVQPPREDEGGHEVPALPVLQVEEAQVGDLLAVRC